MQFSSLCRLEKGYLSNNLPFLCLIYHFEKEADHLELAPTVSSTLALVLGDAIACALSKSYDFKKEDFFKFHPNGALGEALSKECK